MSMTVDARELHALERRFGSLQGAVARAAVPAVHRVVLAEERNAKRDAKVDRGHFRRSITSDVQTTGDRVVGVWGSNLAYARPLEFGRRPGMPWPPPGVLLGWMRRKGIDPGPLPKKRRKPGRPGYRPVEFLIARKIGVKGMDAHPAIRRPRAEVRQRVVREFGQLGRVIQLELTGRG